MKKLLQDLAYLSGLRDRQSMEFALVKLVAQSGLWQFTAVRLLCAVGAQDDQRWMTLAKLENGQSQPQRDKFWFDASGLPRLGDFAQREATIVTESVVRSGQCPYTTTFPINTQASVCSLLEVESLAPVPAEAQALIDSVLHLFENLQGLLDYGERDALTELFNRKTFDGAFLRAAQSQDSADNPQQPDRRNAPTTGSYWLAMVDIDHFKRVNDNFGHLIGDEVLILLSRQMRLHFRHHDQLYRFGGEEFVILMCCAHHADALAVLERFRRQIEQHSFPQVGSITISMGVTPLRDNDTPSAAFGRADMALYHAKAHGRNQVCSFTDLVAAGELLEQSGETDEIDYF